MAQEQHLSNSGRETLRIVDVLGVDFLSVPAQTAPDQAIAVPGAEVGDYVYASPQGVFPAGLTMLPHRVSVAGSVNVRLANVSLGAIDPVVQTVRFCLFKALGASADRTSPSGAIQKITNEVTFDSAVVTAHTAVDQAVLVPDAKIGDIILVTPRGFFPPNVLLGGPHRCAVAGTVQVRFANTSDFDANPISQIYRFTIFRAGVSPTRQPPSGREERRDQVIVFDSASIPAEAAIDQTVLVPLAKPGDSIIVTPHGAFNANLAMGPHRVFTAGEVLMRMGNVSAAPIDPVSQQYSFALFRGPAIAGAPAPSPPSPPAVPLLTSVNYVVLAKTGITNIASSSIGGAMGVSPAAAGSITGFALALDGGGAFATSAQVTGHVFAASYVPPTPATLTQAVLDMQAAYTYAAGQAPDFVEFHAGLLNGEVLVPGVYKWSTGITISGDITLQGDSSSVFIFESAGVLSLAAAKSINLSGGVLPQNVFWQVAGNVLIDVAAHFEGVILCLTNITLNANATMRGKCLAQTAVNFSANTLVNAP